MINRDAVEVTAMQNLPPFRPQWLLLLVFEARIVVWYCCNHSQPMTIFSKSAASCPIICAVHDTLSGGKTSDSIKTSAITLGPLNETQNRSAHLNH